MVLTVTLTTRTAQPHVNKARSQSPRGASPSSDLKELIKLRLFSLSLFWLCLCSTSCATTPAFPSFSFPPTTTTTASHSCKGGLPACSKNCVPPRSGWMQVQRARIFCRKPAERTRT